MVCELQLGEAVEILKAAILETVYTISAPKVPLTWVRQDLGSDGGVASVGWAANRPLRGAHTPEAVSATETRPPKHTTAPGRG